MRLPGVRFIPWAVLALGLATTATLYGFITTAVEKRRKETFNTETVRIHERVEEAFRRQVSFLRATSGLIAADPNVNQEKFAVFESNLIKDIGSPLPFEVGLAKTRPWGRRGELATDALSRGIQNFQFSPQGFRPEVSSVILAKDLGSVPAATPGLDLSVDTARAAAMQIARAKKGTKAAATAQVTSLSNSGVKIAPSLFLFLAVPGEPAEPPQLVYSAIQTNQLFNNLFKINSAADSDSDPAAHFGLRLWIVNGTDRSLLFEKPLTEKRSRHQEELFVLRNVGLSIFAEYQSSEQFDTPAVIGPYVLPVGGTLSALLFLLATSLRRSQEAAQRRADEQRLIAEIGRQTADGGDSDDILLEVARSVAEVFNVICRFDLPRADGSLRWVSTRVENADVLAELERDRPRLKSDSSLVAALDTGLTQRFNGYTPDDEHRRRLHEKLNIGPVAIVPMRARGRSVGAMTLTRPRGRDPLTDNDVAVLESIAGRMALAIDNGRLYEAAQKEIVVRRAAEGEIRRLNESLEEIVSERTRDLEASNQELESFCYSVSHDLRTPLRSLDGFGRALKEDYGDRLDAQGLDFIDRIRGSAKRMDELITALLTLSRLTRREITPVEVNVTEAINDLAHDLDPTMNIRFEVEPEMRTKADPRMFTVVFENLLSNAIKFSSRSENPMIVVAQAEDGTISVKDNGAGFDPRYSNKLFQPFERLHSAREFPGHGIGLATVERIVRRHGGTVRAESRPGEGATFFVRFP